MRTIILFVSFLFCFIPVQAADVKVLSAVETLGNEPSFLIGFAFSLKKEEKIQAPNDETADLSQDPAAPHLILKASDNVKSVKIHWPSATTVTTDGLVTKVYPNHFILPVEVFVKHPGRPVRLRATFHYVSCGLQCMPQKIPVSLDLPQGELRFTPYEGALQAAVKKSQEPVLDAQKLVSFMVLAFLGGMILNLMPCVLPVLALKIAGVMTSRSHKAPRLAFFMVILGITTSFLAFSGGAILLRAFGVQIGWGMHFQQPFFLVAMMLIMVIFSLNLFGFYEIHLPWRLQRVIHRLSPPEHQRHLLGSYCSGVFATLLATPCSAPFLGISVGFALSQEPEIIVAIFIAIALGFSLPYWLLILVPARWIPHPRPGVWMVRLRQFLGVCLLVTAGWLGYVLASQLSSSAEQTHSETDLWKAFAPETIPQLVKDGKVVVVNVTAKWCVTCHLNSSFLARSSEAKALLQGENVVAMQGDWTRRDDTISGFLQRFNRSGIPFTVIFGPRAPQGIVLPEILSNNSLNKAIKTAGDEASRTHHPTEITEINR